METHIAWHPAFVVAIRLELEAYMDSLEIRPEYQLTSEPLRIDCVVIKKAKGLVIKKNIVAIFREVNLLEYKSPADNVSVADFYKVYAYACLYSSLEGIPITDLTISFVESRSPRELMKHLKNVRGYSVEKTSSGIYTVKGDILPIQIIDSRQLSSAENLWLKGLSKRLDAQTVIQIDREAKRQGNPAWIQAYTETVAKANNQALKEARNMGYLMLEMEKALEEAGWTAKWEERKALDIAQNMVNAGYPLDAIVAMTKLDEEKVKVLYLESLQTVK